MLFSNAFMLSRPFIIADTLLIVISQNLTSPSSPKFGFQVISFRTLLHTFGLYYNDLISCVCMNAQKSMRNHVVFQITKYVGERSALSQCVLGVVHKQTNFSEYFMQLFS